MADSRNWRSLTIAMVLLASACGSGSTDTAEQASIVGAVAAETVGEGPVASTSTTTTSEATPTTTAPATTTTPATADLERDYPALPVHEDPCAQQLDVGQNTYSFFVAEEERPVVVEIEEQALLDEQPQLTISFHGAGRGPDVALTDLAVSNDLSPGIFVVPFADGSNNPFWGGAPDFNIDYFNTLYSELAQAFCFDPDRTVITGTGQGTFVVVEAICESDIPIQTAALTLGMLSFLDCVPDRPVPLITMDVFEFRTNLGAYWDGAWDPPGEYERVRSGGIRSTPEALDDWAMVYGCDGPRIEETLPDDDEVLERDTVLYSYPDCIAPLFAFGLENGEGGSAISAAAFISAFNRVVSIAETLDR